MKPFYFSGVAAILFLSIGLTATHASDFIYRYKKGLVVESTVGDGTGNGGTGTGGTGNGGTGSGDTGAGDGDNGGGPVATGPGASDPDSGTSTAACGAGHEFGSLNCTNFSDADTAGTITGLTVFTKSPADLGINVPAVTRCFSFSGGNGNFTISGGNWGDTDWIDHWVIMPVDETPLATETSTGNSTGAYPNNSAFPDRVTDAHAYCVVYYVLQGYQDANVNQQLYNSFSVSDYANADMIGNRHNIYANRQNGLDFQMNVWGFDILHALN